jgi:general secretion pathway protein M
MSALPNSSHRMRQLRAAGVYALVVFGLAIGAVWLARSLYDGYVETTALRERLHQLNARAGVKPKPPAFGADAEDGSPLIEGATLTQAGAALQQRVERAVTRAGGAMRSSQVALRDSRGTPGSLGLSADLELPEAAMQPFLYDLEAGMPYLFVDSFSARTLEATQDAQRPRLRVALSLSGKWSGRP